MDGTIQHFQLLRAPPRVPLHSQKRTAGQGGAGTTDKVAAVALICQRRCDVVHATSTANRSRAQNCRMIDRQPMGRCDVLGEGVRVCCENSGGLSGVTCSCCKCRLQRHNGKAVLYRDTVTVDTGSGHFFGSVSVSKRHFFGIEGTKDTFSYSKDTLKVSKIPETVSVSVSPKQIFCIGNSLASSDSALSRVRKVVGDAVVASDQTIFGTPIECLSQNFRCYYSM